MANHVKSMRNMTQDTISLFCIQKDEITNVTGSSSLDFMMESKTDWHSVLHIYFQIDAMITNSSVPTMYSVLPIKCCSIKFLNMTLKIQLVQVRRLILSLFHNHFHRTMS